MKVYSFKLVNKYFTTNSTTKKKNCEHLKTDLTRRFQQLFEKSYWLKEIRHMRFNNFWNRSNLCFECTSIHLWQHYRTQNANRKHAFIFFFCSQKRSPDWLSLFDYVASEMQREFSATAKI